jgi:hypothetical protein
MMQQAYCLSESDLLHLQRNELYLREIELDSFNTTNIISAHLLERDSIFQRSYSQALPSQPSTWETTSTML